MVALVAVEASEVLEEEALVAAVVLEGLVADLLVEVEQEEAGNFFLRCKMEFQLFGLFPTTSINFESNRISLL